MGFELIPSVQGTSDQGSAGFRYRFTNRGFPDVSATKLGTFFRNARLRSLLASLCFRWRWNRALSPLIADMVTQASVRPRHRLVGVPAGPHGAFLLFSLLWSRLTSWPAHCAVQCTKNLKHLHPLPASRPLPALLAPDAGAILGKIAKD